MASTPVFGVEAIVLRFQLDLCQTPRWDGKMGLPAIERVEERIRGDVLLSHHKFYL
jgi:hypothetical protein